MRLPGSRHLTLIVAWAFMLSAAPSADVFVAPFAGLKFGGYTSIVDLELAAGKTGGTIGASVFLLDDGIVGYEVSFAHVPRYFEFGNSGLITPGSYVIDLTGNVIVALPPNVTRGGLRPYVIGGVGLIHAEAADVLGIFQVRRTVPAAHGQCGRPVRRALPAQPDSRRRPIAGHCGAPHLLLARDRRAGAAVLGAARKLARFRVHLHLFAFLDEKRHLDLESRLEHRRLGDAAARRVATHAHLG